MTVEFFDEGGTDHGIVKIRILPNTRLNRRVWWYWWERDDLHFHHGRPVKPKPQYFTTRWETIWKVWLNRISAECIGRLIIRWLRTNDYAIYQVAKNNCQHFVRDITASLDVSAAKKLNSLFDHKVIASVLPAVAVADGMTEEVRMYEIRDILIDEMNHYNKGQQKRKMKQIHAIQSKQERLKRKRDQKSKMEEQTHNQHTIPLTSPRGPGPISFSPRTEKIPRFELLDSNESEQRGRSSAISNDGLIGLPPIEPVEEEEVALLADKPLNTLNIGGGDDHKVQDSLDLTMNPMYHAKMESVVRLRSLIMENGLEVDNFNEIDAFFIEEDKTRIIEHVNALGY